MIEGKQKNSLFLIRENLCNLRLTLMLNLIILILFATVEGIVILYLC